MRNCSFVGAALLVIACAGDPAADAQTYPRVPSPWWCRSPPGADRRLTRIVAERMRASLGQTVIIENVTGADGGIGVGRVARAAPDGYTLGIGQWGTHVLNGAAYALPYDLLKDFEPVALIATNPEVIVSNTAVPAKDLEELIAWLKPNRARCRWGWLRCPTASPRSTSRTSPARASSSCPIAAPVRRCRTWSPARSTSCSTSRRIRCRRCAAAPSRPMRSPPGAARLGAGHPDRGRGRAARILHLGVDGAVGAQGNAQAIVARLNAAVVEALADPAARRASPISARTSRRATSRRRPRSARCKRRRSRSGGRSSRRRTSSRNERRRGSISPPSARTAPSPTLPRERRSGLIERRREPARTGL